ncbi:MAG: selenocysteine-specific translation elongation factor [Proteobacteria bacterium]|nr:selenocysteine-specific translation elongation factor [Pseudomonadota bacterium]
MIVGTAGHIDHGKTLLIKALTGIDCDRLKEEKARGITIELGFAYVPLPGGGTLGFVDVPGHERFVHTMLAGAASIDFVLLVVAADDGVMPQTREHLQILHLLGLSEGVVALNKADLVDAARLAEVEAETRAALAGTGLAATDIIPVSAATGAGIQELKERLLEEAESRPERAVAGAFRMAVDRAFTVAGAGTVATGIVISGRTRIGDTVVVSPSGEEARIRTVHALGKSAEEGVAGQRVALNLAGLDRDAIQRGAWLLTPDQRLTSQRFDVRLALQRTETRSLTTWTPVHLHFGTSAVEARVVLLDCDKLAPGETGLAQIVAQEPLPVRTGDRLILRDAGAERTIAGGAVVDPMAPQRFRRTPERLARLEALGMADASEALERLLAAPPGLIDLDTFLTARGLSPAEIDRLLAGSSTLVAHAAGRRYAADPAKLLQSGERLETRLAAYHQAQPERLGAPTDTIRTSIEPRLSRPDFAALLALLAPFGKVVVQSGLVRLASHTSTLGPADQRLWERLEALIGKEQRYRPPQVRELAEATGQPVANVRKLLKTMARLTAVVEVAPDRFFLRAALIELGTMAGELASASAAKTFSAAEFRDRAGSGRNVGIQILEHFDRRGLTLRQGDVRRVVKDPAVVFGDRQPG